MNYLELVGKVWKKCALAGEGPGAVTSTQPMESRIIRYASDAYEFVQQKNDDWPFRWQRRDTQPLTVGQNVYDPDALVWPNLNRLHRVCLQNAESKWYPIEIVDSTDTYEFDNPDDGVPTKVGRLRSGEIVFNRRPESALAVRADYFRDVHRLSMNTSVLLIPDDHIDVVVYKAQEYYAVYDEDPSLLKEALTGFALALARMERVLLPVVAFSQSAFLGGDE